LFTPTDGRAEPQLAAPAIAEAARRAGATIMTSCAARGLETAAGRVSCVATENGPILCNAVVLAGGAWSRLFCGNIGVNFPQLKILGSAMRTAPIEGAPEYAVGASNFAFRKRLDGGYTIAHRGANETPITPDSFRLFFDFLPSLAEEWRNLRLRIGRRFIEEWNVPRRWTLDAPSPRHRLSRLSEFLILSRRSRFSPKAGPISSAIFLSSKTRRSPKAGPG
jgi:glycine/D-amino acid oxidase-like deaminating enzyme